MGTVNANFLPTATGLDLGSPSQRWDLNAQTIDASGNATISGNATVAGSLSVTGTLALNGSAISLQESTAPSGTSGSDILYADSSAHRLKMNNNNGGADVVVGATTTDTLTNKTLTGASSGNSITKLNLQQVTGTFTGTGAAQTVFTYNIPANTTANGKAVRITAKFFHSSGTASVTYTWLIAGVSVGAGSPSASTGTTGKAELIIPVGATTTQQFASELLTASPSWSLNAASGTFDPTLTNTVAFQFNVANTDQLIGEIFLVELIA